MQLDFWFDLSCPYAYLASRRLGAMLAGRAAELRYRPMLLGGVFRAIGAGEGPMATLPPPKREHLAKDLLRWADLDGTPLTTPAGHPMRTVRALRTLLGVPEAQWPEAVTELYATYWEHGEDITQDAPIAAALRRAGVDDATIAAALAGADSEERKAELHARTDEAVKLGIFGAPGFVVHTAAGPRLVWGQDRMHWVQALLDGWQPPAPPPPAELIHVTIPRVGAPPSDATRAAGTAEALPLQRERRPDSPSDDATRAPDSPRDATRGGVNAEALPRQRGRERPLLIDFYFDSSSPYAYLGLTQIAHVAAGHTLRLRPILLGGLFKALGITDVPLFSFPESKRRYIVGEMALWSAWWQQPFAFPKKFPQRTLTAQRILVSLADEPAAQLRLAQAFGRAMWAEDRNLEDDAVIAAILAAEGLPAERLAAAAEPAVKAALLEATNAAAAAGVFGVPTCIVDDGAGPRRFWGQDRLHLVSAALAGWRAAGDA